MDLSIEELLKVLASREDCLVKEPCGQPRIDGDYELPVDVKKFYDRCGGVTFKNSSFGFEIVQPDEVKPINPIIVGELCEDDISSKWYAICKDANNDYISIDLDDNRKGRCYDSFWDRHGVVGECAIVAFSFTELVTHLLYDQGSFQPYWLTKDFNYLGDAYDEM